MHNSSESPLARVIPITAARQPEPTLIHKLLRAGTEFTAPPTYTDIPVPEFEEPLFEQVQGDNKTGFRSAMTENGLVIDWHENDRIFFDHPRYKLPVWQAALVIGGGVAFEAGALSIMGSGDAVSIKEFLATTVGGATGFKTYKHIRRTEKRVASEKKKTVAQRQALEVQSVIDRAVHREKSLVVHDIEQELPIEYLAGLMDTEIELPGVTVPASRAFIALEGLAAVTAHNLNHNGRVPTLSINPAHGIANVLKQAGADADFLIQYTLPDITAVSEQQLAVKQGAEQLALFDATGRNDTQTARDAAEIHHERVSEYLTNYLRIGAAQVALIDNHNLNSTFVGDSEKLERQMFIEGLAISWRERSLPEKVAAVSKQVGISLASHLIKGPFRR